MANMQIVHRNFLLFYCNSKKVSFPRTPGPQFPVPFPEGAWYQLLSANTDGTLFCPALR